MKVQNGSLPKPEYLNHDLERF